ncbi:hypothetical protein BFJ63_vAg10819 [Fusarium oxysporum f. sp. narcissi]|nr:hypothetical protein BFJ63_vAg10819 [Fusarium oxysporum f. sp. narcissi]
MDKRSVAAAIALGASGVVMGTRFLASYEIEVDDQVADECLAARDGGETTVRSRVFDDIWGHNFWPDMYDGRCLRNAMYDNVEEEGMSIQEARLALSTQNGGEGFVMRDSYTIWAGTGVGMLKKKEKAANIVKQIREETKDLMGSLTEEA